MANDLLLYSNSYWKEKLGPEFQRNNLENKLHLIFSLLVFLEISLAQFLTFIFSSKIEKVKSRAGRFMGYTETANDEDTRFPPSAIWRMWLENFPKCKSHIYEMIRPTACEIALGESDKIIEDRLLQVKMKDLTIASIRELLQPEKIIEKYQELAPFTWAILERFAASPNKWRRRAARKEMAPVDKEGEGSDWDDDPNIDDEEAPDSRWHNITPEGFARNPTFVSVTLRTQKLSLTTYIGRIDVNFNACLCTKPVNEHPSTFNGVVLQDRGHKLPSDINTEQHGLVCVRQNC